MRASLDSAQGRLQRRLLDLYVRGEPDPLAVLLGAQSLDEALSQIDDLNRVAKQDVSIIRQVRQARVALCELAEEACQRFCCRRA